jgi:hypothetical protein
MPALTFSPTLRLARPANAQPQSRKDEVPREDEARERPQGIRTEADGRQVEPRKAAVCRILGRRLVALCCPTTDASCRFRSVVVLTRRQSSRLGEPKRRRGSGVPKDAMLNHATLSYGRNLVCKTISLSLPYVDERERIEGGRLIMRWRVKRRRRRLGWERGSAFVCGARRRNEAGNAACIGPSATRRVRLVGQQGLAGDDGLGTAVRFWSVLLACAVECGVQVEREPSTKEGKSGGDRRRRRRLERRPRRWRAGVRCSTISARCAAHARSGRRQCRPGRGRAADCRRSHRHHRRRRPRRSRTLQSAS